MWPSPLKPSMGDNTITSTAQALPPGLSPACLRDLMRVMVFIRRFEEKIIEVYGAEDMKSPVHLYIGQEAVGAGVCANLRRDDYIFTTHRSHGHCLAKGMAARDLYAEFYGRVTGCCRGKGGSMHPAFPALGIHGTTAIVGGGIPLAAGTALASRLQNTDRVSVVFFGDGASDQGAFHEVLNFAALKKLPLLLVCENNFYATSSPLSARQPHPDIYLRAGGYGIPGVSVDGNDVIAVYLAAQEAVDRARRGDGPTLLECKTYRWRGHVGPDCDWEKGCRPKEELEDWMNRCPVESFKKRLSAWGAADEAWQQTLVKDIDAELDQALQFARESAFPAPEEVNLHLYWEKNT